MVMVATAAAATAAEATADGAAAAGAATGEWYHLSCMDVEMEDVESGIWYCPTCEKAMP